MKKLIMLTLLALFSTNNTLLTNSVPNLSNYWNEYYLANYQIMKQYNIISEKASTILNFNESSLLKLPLGLPIKQDSIKRISSYFGERKSHPILRIRTFHNGIDIVAEKGTQVCATAEGKVMRTGYDFYGFGKYVEIRHTQNITTIYAHLDKININKGDSVNMSTILGYVGSTGLSTGNHLHYELRSNYLPIDPLKVYEDLGFLEKDLIQVSDLTKFVQMNTKTIKKEYTLDQLKELKDKYTKKINSRQYSIKNKEISSAKEVEKALYAIELDQKNLIRIKEMLAKANSIEFNEKDLVAVETNNYNIYKLALLRDLRTTLNSVKTSKELKEIATEKLKQLNSEITELDETIRKFNSDILVEIELIQ